MLRREEELEQDAGQSQRLRQLQLITSKLQPPAQHATAAGASGPLAPAAPAPAAGSPAASQLLATTAAHQHMLQLCDALDRMDEALQAKADADGAPASPLKSQTPPRKLRPCGAKLTPNVAARQQLHVLRQNLRLLAHPSTALRLSGGGAAADVAAAAAELAGRSAGSSGGGGQPQGQGTAASRPAPASERRLNQQLLQQQGDIMQLLRLLAGDMEADAGRMAAYKRKVGRGGMGEGEGCMGAQMRKWRAGVRDEGRRGGGGSSVLWRQQHVASGPGRAARGRAPSSFDASPCLPALRPSPPPPKKPTRHHLRTTVVRRWWRVVCGGGGGWSTRVPPVC